MDKDILTPAFQKRFWAKVAKGDENDCWPWLGTLNQGYGRIRLNAKTLNAHRVSYFIHSGNIPNDKVIDHICRNRACVNPTHLELVDNKTNILRGFGSSAINARRTHCTHGHELSGHNLYIEKTGRRMCRECHKIRSRKRQPERLKKRKAKSRSALPFGYITSVELRNILGISKSVTENLIRNGCPHINVAGSGPYGINLFAVDAFISWIEANWNPRYSFDLLKVYTVKPKLMEMASAGDANHPFATPLTGTGGA